MPFLSALFTRTHRWLCLQLYPSSFSSSAYFSYAFCWDSEGSLAMSGERDFDLEFELIDQLSSGFFCSKLAGPFFLLSPLSVEGFLVARMVRQIPYLHAGTRWALGGKHEGTSA